MQDLDQPARRARRLLSALGDIAGFRHDDLTVVPATMFTNPVTGTTTSLDFAELSPSLIFRVGPRPGSNAGYSSDGGTTWTPAALAPAGPARPASWPSAADGASVVWSPENAGVHHSDRQRRRPGPPATGLPAGAGSPSDRVDPRRFYGVLRAARST